MSARDSSFDSASRLAGRGQDPAITFLLLLPLGLLHLSAARPADSGAWSLIENALQSLGPWASRALGAGLVLALLWAIGRIRSLGLAWRTGSLAGIVEGVLWGMMLGPVLRFATSVLPLRPRPLALEGTHQELALAAGAGLYEELLFRGLLLGGGVLLLFLLARLLGWSPAVRPALVALALALSSLIFAWAHRVGDPLAFIPEVFAFRALAGLVFGGVFLLRGLAVAAWAHAGYDAFLLLSS
ncbi:MAG: CPBP family glutamic-type intramembrane protease [Planctomycetota bacterium]|nr:CPBP family glutamic-type intramembrane protease [Planctomycetota bacterium]